MAANYPYRTKYNKSMLLLDKYKNLVLFGVEIKPGLILAKSGWISGKCSKTVRLYNPYDVDSIIYKVNPQSILGKDKTNRLIKDIRLLIKS